MKNMKAIVTALIIFIGIPIAILMMIWRDRCVDNEVARSASPDNAFQAATVYQDCGPSMKKATIVRLLPPNEKPDEDGIVLVLHGETKVDVAWLKPRELSLTTPVDATVVIKRAAYRDIALRFETR